MGGLCNSGFVEDNRNAHGVLMGNRLEDLEVDGSVLLKWIEKKYERNM